MRYANYYQKQTCDGSGKIDPIASRGNDWVPPRRGYTSRISEPAFKKIVERLTPGRIIVKNRIVEGWFIAVNLFMVRINE